MKLDDILVPVTGDNAKQLREGDLLYTPTREQLEMDVADGILDEIRSVRVAVSSISGNLGVVYHEDLHGAHSTELTLLRERHGVYRELLPGESKEKLESDKFRTALGVYLKARSSTVPKEAEVQKPQSILEKFIASYVKLSEMRSEPNSGEVLFYIEGGSEDAVRACSEDLMTMMLLFYKGGVFKTTLRHREFAANPIEISELFDDFCNGVSISAERRNNLKYFQGSMKSRLNKLECTISHPRQHGGQEYRCVISFKYSA